MEKIENNYSSKYWVFIWLVNLFINAVFIIGSHGINYTAILGALLSLWMLSLIDAVIDKISKQHKKPIQQILRILLTFILILSTLDFMELI